MKSFTYSQTYLYQALAVMACLAVLFCVPFTQAQQAERPVPWSNARIIYVSFDGNDANSGLSAEEAVQTVERGMSLLRNGQPDWLLLERGHDYAITQAVNQPTGTAPAMPMVIAAYGEGATPQLNVGPNSDKLNQAQQSSSYIKVYDITLTGLHNPFPILQPGNGWAGHTPQPDAVGTPGMPGYDAKAIARWDVVPYQTVDGKFHIGIVAFHINGIDRVSFSVDGGAWVDVHEMQLNPRTDVEEYTVTLDASLFDRDGVIEVRAIAYPEVGVPRVLAGPYHFENEYQNTQWVGEHAMFLHPNAGGGNTDLVVEIPSGTYAWGQLPGVPENYPTDRWLIIRPAPGASVTITPGLWHPQPNMIRLQDVSIRQPTREAVLRGSTDNIVWFDDIEYIGPGMWTRTDTMKMVHAYWTDSTVSESQYGHAQQFIRNCRFTKIGEDTIKNAYLVLNTTVTNIGIPPEGLGWHPAVISNPIYHDNRIYFNMDITGRQKAFAFRHGTQDRWEHNDVAVIRCRAEKTTPGNILMVIGGQTDHMLIEDCTFLAVEEAWIYRLNQHLTIPEWRFTPKNVVLRNNNWFNNPTWLPNPTPLPGVTVIPISSDESVR